jgi:hypothetical protein
MPNTGSHTLWYHHCQLTLFCCRKCDGTSIFAVYPKPFLPNTLNQSALFYYNQRIKKGVFCDNKKTLMLLLLVFSKSNNRICLMFSISYLVHLVLQPTSASFDNLDDTTI